MKTNSSNDRFYTWLNRNGLSLGGNLTISQINCAYMGYIGVRLEEFQKVTTLHAQTHPNEFDSFLLSRSSSLRTLVCA